MPRVTFTANLLRHISLTEIAVEGGNLAEALHSVFSRHPQVRSYLLDDQGAVRKHVVIFLDGTAIADRTHLTDPVRPDTEICVMQALSGG